jgi:methyl-CpG-binding domain protein 4
MIFARSRRHLIQEDHYPDEFRVLVCCLLLNRTRGTQVRGVIDKLFTKYACSYDMARADEAELISLLQPLGFQKQRAKRLIKFADVYQKMLWQDVRELPGVGQYAFDCWKIFFLEELGDVAPNDHALLDFWNEAQEEGSFWPKSGWGFDPEVERRRRRVEDLGLSSRGMVRLPKRSKGSVS